MTELHAGMTIGVFIRAARDRAAIGKLRPN
jgi:hypothetical protein